MNGTFVYRDGTGLDVRYNVGIRNRGHGTRDFPPNNYRVNIPSDRPWEDLTAININSKYTYLQVFGNILFNRAGLFAPGECGTGSRQRRRPGRDRRSDVRQICVLGSSRGRIPRCAYRAGSGRQSLFGAPN